MKSLTPHPVLYRALLKLDQPAVTLCARDAMMADTEPKTIEEQIQQLEMRRAALNQRLMNAGSIDEGNEIERELWALRAEIAYRRSLQE